MLSYRLVQKTKIIERRGAVSDLGQLCLEHDYHKAFLVFDQGVARVGIIDKITAVLDRDKITYVLYDRIRPDPTSDLVDEGAVLCKDSGCDCVIAIGGGSVMDAGKGINVMRSNKGKILDYVGREENICPSTGLICIPTTAGTGSELSNWIVITDQENGDKHPINVKNSMSEFALLDPELTIGLPPQITAGTGLDVFSHAFEAYTSILSNPVTDLICEKLMEDVIRWLPVAVHNGNDIKAREKMLVCASYGGFLLVDNLVHIGHCIAHEIGARFHIPHGNACAYAFPEMVRHIAATSSEKILYTGNLLGADLTGQEPPKEIAEKTITVYKKFRDQTLGLNSIQSYHPDCTKVNLEMAERILNDPITSMTPKETSIVDILAMLYRIFVS